MVASKASQRDCGDHEGAGETREDVRESDGPDPTLEGVGSGCQLN
jgi:hypothetical protein